MPGRLGGEINDTNTNTFHFISRYFSEPIYFGSHLIGFDLIWFDSIAVQTASCAWGLALRCMVCSPKHGAMLNYRILCDELERSFAIRCLKQVLNDRPITHRPSSQITITIQAASLGQGNGNGERGVFSSGHHVQTMLVFESLISLFLILDSCYL